MHWQISFPDDGDPKAIHIALNSVSDHVSVTVIPSTAPSPPINYVTVKPDCLSCPTLYVAALASTRRLCGAILAGYLGSQSYSIIPHSHFYLATILCLPHRLYWAGMWNSKGSGIEGDGPNSESCSAAYGNVEVTLQGTKTGHC
ncbi:unnamed protein product, partial [Taenia asiatica]|uniref:P-loop containing nucleoside triphosphatehydrolases superfamily protein n=1 Tax=Taenia asiatica TaxID=60517 RepID=A0A0R3W0G6_TAEAS